MPKNRQPNYIWQKIRKKVWQRDNGKCVHCNKHVSLKECHIDHIISGKKGRNSLDNLRTLCPKCHILRRDFRHRGMTAKALKNGLIPPNWRELTW